MVETFMNTKIPTLKNLEKAFQLVAYSSLKENNEPINFDNIEAESARITRCVEHHYKIDKEVKFDYLQFASNFLQENFRQLVFGKKFLGNYLDGIPEGIEKKFYMEEARIIR